MSRGNKRIRTSFDVFIAVGVVVAFKSREDHRKQIELEEARKAGLAPAELDEDGKEINPHIPQYMSSAPWYLNAERPVRYSFSFRLVHSFDRHTSWYEFRY